MKRRRLITPIRNFLTTISCGIFTFFMCLDDFQLSAIPYLIAMLIILIFNVIVLERY